jgi:hypothetical protein
MALFARILSKPLLANDEPAEEAFDVFIVERNGEAGRVALDNIEIGEAAMSFCVF